MIDRQTRRPDRVELNLPRRYNRFPGALPALPDLPDWVDVYWLDEDFGPATKVLPTVARYKGTDTRILFSDDDRLHGPNWVKGFDTVSTERPADAITGCGFNIDKHLNIPRAQVHHPRGESYSFTPRAFLPHALTYVMTYFELWHRDHEWRHTTKPGYVDILEGFRGVLIRPHMLGPAAWDIPDEIRPVDDIWLSGQVALTGTGIWLYDEPISHLRDGAIDRLEALYAARFCGMGREALNKNAVHKMQDSFGIWA